MEQLELHGMESLDDGEVRNITVCDSAELSEARVDVVRPESPVPDDVREATILAATGRFGDTPEQVYATMRVAEAFGLHPVAVMTRGMHDFDGNLDYHYTLMATLMRRNGFWYAVQEFSEDAVEIVLVALNEENEPFTKNPITGEPYRVRVEWKVLLQRGIPLGNDNAIKPAWVQYRERMMLSHAIKTMVSAYVPFVLYPEDTTNMKPVVTETEEA